MINNRKLTDKQIFALVCVRNGAVREGQKTLGRRIFTTFFAYDSDITGQIKALRRRKLIRRELRKDGPGSVERKMVLTPEGVASLLRAKAPKENAQ